jgi:ribosomal protein S12 methylthiotransferase
MSVQQGISREIMQGRIGSSVPVLIEEKVDDITWAGRTQWDAPEIDGVFYLTASGCRLHDIVTARVTDAVEYDLIGEA